jgi:hypothetical protein
VALVEPDLPCQLAEAEPWLFRAESPEQSDGAIDGTDDRHARRQLRGPVLVILIHCR